MIEKKYECEVITPMFMSGANQQKFELRPPSINGLLRFWWRASSKISDIDKLRKKEGKIFGSKEKKSKLAIKSSLLESDIKKVKNFKGIFKYLKGYSDTEREYLEPGSKFEIILNFPQEYESEIERSMFCLAKYGGLGARNRNGFGSFDIENFSMDFNVKKYNKVDIRDFHTFSEKSIYYSFKEVNNWKKAMNNLTQIYKDARYKVKESKLRKYLGGPVKNVTGERHAKPYFMTVNKNNNKFYPQILFLPYKYNKNNDFNEYIRAHTIFNRVLKDKAKIIKEVNNA